MADRVMPMGTDEQGTHFLWDSGHIVTKMWDGVWRLTGRVPTATELLEAQLNRESSPEVSVDD